MISAVLSNVRHAGVEDQVLALDAVQRALEDGLLGEVVGYDFAWAFGAGSREASPRTALPGETFALAPTAEPLVPDTLRLFGDPQQTSKIAAHTEVGLHCVSCTACPIVPFGFAPKCPKAADGIHNEWSWAIA